jgi:hypothetical protein
MGPHSTRHMSLRSCCIAYAAGAVMMHKVRADNNERSTKLTNIADQIFERTTVLSKVFRPCGYA